MKTLSLVAALGALLATGCVEPFEGSHIQFALAHTATPCMTLIDNNLPEAKDCQEQGVTISEEQQRFQYHYELWATVNKSSAVHLLSFTVQRHIFPDEQIKMEQDGVLLSSGKPLIMGAQHGYYDKTKSPSMSATDRAIAEKQMAKAKTKFAITSVSPDVYADKTKKALHKDFYLGNYGQLTLPHNGVYHGQVESPHPYGAVTLSGASVRVAPNLQNLDSLWITIDKAPYDRPDPKPNRNLVFMRGTTTRKVRGVINVKAHPTQAFQVGTSAAHAEFGVIPAMGEEEYF